MAFRTPLRTYCEVSDTCEERIVKASLSHIFFKTCFHVFIQMIEAITFSHVSDKKWDSKYDIKFYGIAEGIWMEKLPFLFFKDTLCTLKLK